METAGGQRGAPLRDLLARYRQDGDEGAFEQLVRHTHPQLEGVARRIAGIQEAEDCVQAAYRSLVQRGELPEGVPVQGWLVTAVVRLAWRSVATRRRQSDLVQRLAAPPPLPPPEQEAMRAEEAALLWREVQRLPGLYRDVVVLHHLQGLSVSEVARLGEVPEKTVYTRLRRARRLLHGRLAPRLLGGVLASLWFLSDRAEAATVALGLTSMGVAVKLKVITIVALVCLAGGVVLWQTGGREEAPAGPSILTPPAPPPEATAAPGVATPGPLPADPVAPDGTTAGLETTPALTIAGVVIDDLDRPVPEAQVKAWPPGQEPAASPVAGTTTAMDGTFSLEGLEAGQLRVKASHPDHLTDRSFFPGFMADVPAGEQGLVLRLVRGGAIAGTVVDPDGVPLAGATVAAQPGGWWRYATEPGSSPRVTSGEDGSFRLRGIPESFSWVGAFASGHVPGEPQEVHLERGATVDGVVLRLQEAASITGRVELRSGQTVAGATVGCTPPEGWPTGSLATATTDAQGAFRLTPLVPGLQYLLGATAEGLAVELESLVSRIHAAGARDVVLVMVPEATVRGTVLLRSGEVVAAARIELRPLEYGGGTAAGRHEVQTDPAGTYALHGIGPGRYRIGCQKDGLAPAEDQDLRLAPGEHREGVDFLLEPGRRIEGRVQDEGGQPLARVLVSTTGPGPSASARTGEDGAFSLEGVGPGWTGIQVRAQMGYLPVDPVTGTLEARPGLPVTFTMGRGATVVGQVVTADGSAVPRFTVLLSPAHARDRRRPGKIVNAEGRFRLDGLRAGRATLQVQAEGLAPVERRGLLVPAAATLDLGRIVLEAGATLRGRVVREDGAAVAGATVTLELPRVSTVERRQLGLQTALSEPDGSFLLGQVPAGRLVLSASGEGLAPARLVVEAPDRGELGGLLLRLSAGGSIAGQVRQAGGHPLAGVEVTASRWGGEAWDRAPGGPATTDAAGRYRLEHLLPGHYFVSATLPRRVSLGRGYVHSGLKRRVDVAEGETTACDLAGGGCRLHGRVLGLGEVEPGKSLHLMGRAMSTGASIDPQGNYEFPGIPPGDYALNVLGLGMATLRVPDAPEHHFDVDLAQYGGEIRGTVRRADGRTVAGCRVSCEMRGESTYHGYRAPVRGDGTYEVLHRLPGTYDLTLRIPEYGTAMRRGVTVTPGQVVAGVDLMVRPGGTLQVRVHGPSGAPVAGVRMRVLDPGGQSLATQDRSYQLEPGRWEVTGLPVDAPLLVAAGCVELGTAWVETEARAGGVTSTCTVQLGGAAGRCRLIATRGGQPLGQAFVELRDPQGRPVLDLGRPGFALRARTDEHGVYETGLLPAGTYTLQLPSGEGAPVERPVTVPGAEQVLIELE